MKKFFTEVYSKKLNEAKAEIEQKNKEEYAKFFQSLLEKFRVNSLADLDEQDKAAFLSELSTGWTARNKVELEEGTIKTFDEHVDSVKEEECEDEEVCEEEEECEEECDELEVEDKDSKEHKEEEKSELISKKDLESIEFPGLDDEKRAELLELVMGFYSDNGMEISSGEEIKDAPDEEEKEEESLLDEEPSDEEGSTKKESEEEEEEMEESVVFEAEVKSEKDFREYAQTVLKKAFSEEYDEEKADKVISGIIGKVDGDWGAAIGMLTSGLG